MKANEWRQRPHPQCTWDQGTTSLLVVSVAPLPSGAPPLLDHALKPQRHVPFLQLQGIRGRTARHRRPERNVIRPGELDDARHGKYQGESYE